MTDKPLQTARISIVNFDSEAIETTVRKIKKMKSKKALRKGVNKSNDKMNEDLCEVRKKAKKLMRKKKKKILVKVDNSKMKDAEEDYDNTFFGVKHSKDRNDILNSNSKEIFEVKEEKKKRKHKRSK